MSNTTIKIQDTLNWVAAFVQQRPTTGVAGIPNEPGLTAANKVMQSILAPPFKWSWNRKEDSTLTCTAGTTDYAVSLSDWGFLEKAYGTLASNDPPVFEIEVAQVLSKESKENRPQKIAPITDDNNGTITFRLLPAPDKAYVITLEYQKAAILVSSVGATWAPIPDRYAFLYEAGLLAYMQGIYSAQLYMANMQIFFRQLVGAAEGLTATEKAIFLEDQLRILRTQSNSAMDAAQGKQVRL